jgi:hypothetical protein
MCATVVTGFHELKTVLDNLQYKKLCARLVAQMLMPDHKEKRVQVCTDILECYETIISLTASSVEVRPGYTITNQSQSSSLWSSYTRIHNNNKIKAQPSAGRRLRMMTSRK